MAKKADFVKRLIQEVKPRYPLPAAPKEGLSLMEQGAVLVLMRHLTQAQAEASVEALRDGIGDWNEARVCQVQELAPFIKTSSRKKGMELLNSRAPAARALKDYLQDVFQQTHGLDLEHFREDGTDISKLMEDFEVLDLPSIAYLFWFAREGEMPSHLGLLKLLDRLGLIPRTTSASKGRASMEALLPKKEHLSFVLAIHEVFGHWADEEDPSYVTHELLRTLPYGQKAFDDREASIRREKIAAEKEAAREAIAAKKKAELEAKELEKVRKRQEAAASKVRKAREKMQRIAARKVAAEDKKKAVLQKIADQKKAAADKKVAEAKAKKVAAKKAIEDKKKAAVKKVADKKAAVKKAAEDKKTAVKKAAESKKAAGKKAADQKKAAVKKAADQKKAAVAKKTPVKKQPVAKKAPAKKAPAKKAPAKKAPAKKPATKKAQAKKPVAKKAAAKKAPAKKAAAKKKPVAKKKAAKKATRKR
ncbi:MAG: hypothetical protein JKY61_08260 [Planctomycetes bacterium]|nr:hypothetical protein [Planctomycetota bacterium]